MVFNIADGYLKCLLERPLATHYTELKEFNHL
jgi:hypothetical protein